MMKSLSSAFLIAIMVSGFALAGVVHFGTVQASTDVTGIIYSDTTWTPSGSPYTLTGNTLVYQGVTLTIQPGVTVNLGSYYIKVDGTLSARGNPTDKITFKGGQITFTTSSDGWNEQTDSGCLIENAIISQTSIFSSNPLKIDKSIINGRISVTSSIISNNIVQSDINSRSSVISNNKINGKIALGSFSPQSLTASEELSTVSNNIIDGSISSISPKGTPKIFNNTVSNGGIGCSGYGSIFNNYIYGCEEGISLYTVRVFGGHIPCFATVENNLVVNNLRGISIELSSVFGPGTECPTIQNNTISGNSIGIFLSESLYDSTPTILNNNLQNNSNYNFYLDAPNNVDVTYNWWGTTGTQAINQTIYDFKDDFNLGKVTFVPFLTEPNPKAMPNPIPEIPDTKPPTISIASPENKTYAVTNVSLTFTVNENASWIGYSLDGQANVTISGNTTLIGLSDGPHSLVVYATDTAGNTGASETIYFTAIHEGMPRGAPYDRFTRWAELAVAVSLMIVAAVATALLIYFAKVRKTTGKVEK